MRLYPCIGAIVNKDNTDWRDTISGFKQAKVYYYVKFSVPSIGRGTISGPEINERSSSITGDRIGGFLKFKAGEVIVAVSVSHTSMARAKQYFEDEFAEMAFDAAAGRLKDAWIAKLGKVNCRIIAPSGSNDSLWVRIQGATTQTTNHSSGWVRWNDMAGRSGWEWDVVHSSDGGNAEVEWTMAAGTYTLDVAYREEGALVDAIVIEKIVLPPPPTEELWIEAEDASPIGALLQVVDDAAASGGKYITGEAGKNSTSAPNIPDCIAAWTFAVEGGTYKVEARLTTLADNDNDDSCWFRIQGAAVNRTIHSSGWIRHNDARPRGGPWGLDEVHSSEDGNQVVYFTLSPGSHTLEWGYREDGLFLDAIKISNVVE